jgi:hypothetical protein
MEDMERGKEKAPAFKQGLLKLVRLVLKKCS